MQPFTGDNRLEKIVFSSILAAQVLIRKDETKSGSLMISRILIIVTTLIVLGSNRLPAEEISARSLLLSQGCKGCHAFEGDGGTLGPALDKVGSRLTVFQIEQILLNPKLSNPDSVMPSFKHLKDEERKSLADFLHTRK